MVSRLQDAVNSFPTPHFDTPDTPRPPRDHCPDAPTVAAATLLRAVSTPALRLWVELAARGGSAVGSARAIAAELGGGSRARVAVGELVEAGLARRTPTGLVLVHLAPRLEAVEVGSPTAPTDEPLGRPLPPTGGEVEAGLPSVPAVGKVPDVVEVAPAGGQVAPERGQSKRLAPERGQSKRESRHRVAQVAPERGHFRHEAAQVAPLRGQSGPVLLPSPAPPPLSSPHTPLLCPPPLSSPDHTQESRAGQGEGQGEEGRQLGFELVAPGSGFEPADPVRAVFDHWRERTWPGRGTAPKLDGKRRRQIKAALGLGYSVEDLCRSVDGYVASPWHNGEETGRRYLQISTLFADADHVESGWSHLPKASPAARATAAAKRWACPGCGDRYTVATVPASRRCGGCGGKLREVSP